ncbi:ribosome-associated toxin RatA of RatAB toxin-antitoxin module [Pedobacter sp. CG_S7]|uniref:hypothetical protein n=1 Tax=Pedobacter sp. CG_S7 TaxID=3143930 RepID=UPI003396897B
MDKDSIKVGVPDYIYANKDIQLGIDKWGYSGRVIQLPSTLNLKQTIPVKPYTRLTSQWTITVHQYAATYVATFVSQPSGRVVKITGKWTGTYPVKANIISEVEEVK